MKRCWLLVVVISLLYSVAVTAKINDLRSHPKPQVDYIHIEKQKRRMTVFFSDKKPVTYRIALGFSPLGPKEVEGDGKTPEGIYTITYKNSQSQFHRSLKLSYPTKEDWQRAGQQGMHPGSDIMIHGLGERLQQVGKWHARKDWTLGCIAVTNEEIEELYHLAEVGTKVKISP